MFFFLGVICAGLLCIIYVLLRANAKQTLFERGVENKRQGLLALGYLPSTIARMTDCTVDVILSLQIEAKKLIIDLYGEIVVYPNEYSKSVFIRASRRREWKGKTLTGVSNDEDQA